MMFGELLLVVGMGVIIYVLVRAKHFSAMSNGTGEDGDGHSAREAEMELELKELRERVKVLERIATDDRGPRLLSDEIEKLRDK